MYSMHMLDLNLISLKIKWNICELNDSCSGKLRKFRFFRLK